MSNFDFLKTEWLDIYKLASEAEECVYSKPVYTCILCRNALESAVKWMYKNDIDLVEPYDCTLNSLVHEQSFKNVIVPPLFQKVNLIRINGNTAAHNPQRINDKDALQTTFELFHFLYWLYLTYSKDEPVHGLKFDVSKVPTKTKEQEEIERLKKIIEEQNAINITREDLEKENAELLEQIKQIKAQNKSKPLDYDYNEAQTRKYFINVLLKEVGWDISAPNATEYEVQGMPNPTGLGYVDYVLWGDDGKPLGLVEAKRTMKDAKIGREQAELYANCLEKKFGQRPIIFYTNGYEHFIWDDLNYPPREVAGFYSKEDLEKLITRRTIRKDLVDIDINKDISGRPYQERVIKSVCENYAKKSRKSLLVMATGTGKTRVAISIVDILTRYNWVKRVLFLADRTPLVTQAQRAFAKYLPDLNPVDITKVGVDGAENRVVVSTYHTMMNLIDAKKANEKLFSVGHFDLIIIDEAHRSIYKKFGEIFNYFDGLLLGLTATPRDEVDKNTYKVFELEDGVPTDYYDYDEAVEQGYLVPYEQFDCATKFLREGIKYNELSAEEKEEYEIKFYDEETETLPEEIDAAQLNKWLFNIDTVDKILECLMENGIKVNGGDKLGKTIIFAANENHAQFIAERFDANYKQYNGKFARVITHKTQYSQNLIDKFATKEEDPVIAISVDKLDTGIDVPEILNLVFFKVVRSRTKFHQMIGRGTRLCPELFGPQNDKKKFFIFDACGNFEYFSINPEGAKSSNQMSLGQKIFLKKLELAEKIKDDNEVLKLLSNKIKDDLHNTVITMNRDNFIVRRHLRAVDEFSNREKWDSLDDMDFITIKDRVSHLPTTLPEEDEYAKRFDLMILNTQLSYYAHDMVKFEKYQKNIKEIAFRLEEKSSIPLVKQNLELIQSILTDEFWANVTVSILEEVRIKLRNLVNLIDYAQRDIIYSDFEDELDPIPGTVSVNTASGVDIAQYKKKVEAFLQAHVNDICINKLKFNKPLTELDIEQLEKILFENSDIGSREQLQTIQEGKGLGEFIRSIIGVERAEIEKVFSEYLDNNKFNSNQIRFVETIIDYIKCNGTMDTGKLFEQPFTFINTEGLDGVFAPKDADNIIYLINEINKNARLYN